MAQHVITVKVESDMDNADVTGVIQALIDLGFEEVLKYPNEGNFEELFAMLQNISYPTVE